MGMNDLPAHQQKIQKFLRLRDRLSSKELSESERTRILDEITAILEEIGGTRAYDQKGQQVNTQVNIYAVPSVEENSIRHTYLNFVRHRSENVPLRGLGLTASISNPNIVRGQRMRLSEIYVDLDTTSTILSRRENSWNIPGWDDILSQESSIPLALLDAASQKRRLVILGDPGSGKTTFLRYLALCIASAQIDKENSLWLSRLPRWDSSDFGLTPILISLRDVARWMMRRRQVTGVELLWRFTYDMLASLGLDEFSESLKHDVYEGKAILLLDGLDEINVHLRSLVRDMVVALAEVGNSRIIVTCRTLSYSDPHWQIDGFEHVEIAPFRDTQIRQFIKLWHREMVHTGMVNKTDAQVLETRLQQTLENNHDLWIMASNPLLLETMAIVHTHEGFLPQNRVLLYEDCVDLLLWNWEELKIPTGAVREPIGIRSLLRQAGLQDIDFKRAFWQIAYELFVANEDEISVQNIVNVFRQTHPNQDWNWASDVVTAIQERAGLISEHEPGKFSFPHRTFQEFLAASYLASLPDFGSRAAQWAFHDSWREVLSLSVGRLVHISGDISKALDLVAEMLLRDDIETLPSYGLLAAELLAEIGSSRILGKRMGKILLDKVLHLLLRWLYEGSFPPRQRNRLGRALSLLGDPRFDPNLLYFPVRYQNELEDFLGFVFIPEGEFIMGPKGEEHKVFLSGYYISRYPVTEAQYWQFIQETNRAKPSHWIDGRPLPHALNKPVVNVSWYDALAYCRWLTRRLGNLDLNEKAKRAWNETDKLVLLPTEAEWEKACRGVSAKNVFAWGDEYMPGKTNTREENLGEPIAVGLFPEGVSPYGIWDMGGNVREWTTTRYWNDDKVKFDFPYRPNDGREDLSRNDNVTRVIRGGAYHLDHSCSDCSFRIKNFPVDRHPYFGFRLAIHQKV